MDNFEIQREIEKILDNNIEDIPFEGKEIDKPEIVNDLLILINKIKSENNEQ